VTRFIWEVLYLKLFDLITFFFLIFLLFLGIGFGIISSTPLGPINLLVAENCLSKPKIKIIPFLFGVIIIDSIFGYLTFLGFDKFLTESPKIGIGIGVFGGISIILLGGVGVYQLLTYKEAKTSNIEIKKNIFLKSSLASFGKGFVLCGSNPGFIAFWAWVAYNAQGWITQLFPNAVISNFNLLLFSLGIVIGDFLWFGFFIHLLKKGAKKYNPNVLTKIRLVISFILIVLGIYTLVESIS
jgi:threonine/homoserine/homoserine lactone efflux protein